MRRDCKNFCKREKHSFSNHLYQANSHFCRKMDATSFMKKMDLPNDFSRNFKGQIGENVELKGPSGKMWRVGIIKSAKKFAFQSGWKDFVIANYVEANDLLIFKYDGDSSFQVQIFASNGCERTSSFFARIEETKVQESSDSSTKVFERLDPVINRDKVIIDGSSNDSEEYSTDGTPVKMTRGRWRREAGTSKEPNGQCKTEALNNEQIPFVGKNCMTPAQKERLLKLSKGIERDNHCFAVLMKTTMIMRHCQYGIPMEFASKFLSQNPKNASLHYKGCTWPLSIYYKRGTFPYVSDGWRQFVKGNNLNLGDICLFELMKNKKSPSFKVHILRN